VAGRVVYVWDERTGALVVKYDDHAMKDEKVRHVLEKKRYNVPPASHLPILVGEGTGTKVRVARWGFPIPQRPNGVFNARIENVASSPMWKGLFGKSHGLFFLHGFYEWSDKGRKEPYFIHRNDGELLLLAALVGTRAIEGEPRLCASIITCEPNPQVGRIHDRMPVVIEEKDAASWLHPETAGLKQCMDLARPAGDGVLAFHEVGPDVNSFKNDRPDLMQPLQREV
jgi:putative SOS response-associated peptidase YedK